MLGSSFFSILLIPPPTSFRQARFEYVFTGKKDVIKLQKKFKIQKMNDLKKKDYVKRTMSR